MPSEIDLPEYPTISKTMWCIVLWKSERVKFKYQLRESEIYCEPMVSKNERWVGGVYVPSSWQA